MFSILKHSYVASKILCKGDVSSSYYSKIYAKNTENHTNKIKIFFLNDNQYSVNRKIIGSNYDYEINIGVLLTF